MFKDKTFKEKTFKENKFKIKNQIRGLYISSILGNLSLTGAWVAILAARGYSLVEIGLAETVFHIVSILFEIPSGVLADVWGRKKMLMLSTFMRMIGNVVMIASCNLSMVCISIGFQALAYNFSSGSGDALAYDSLKRAGKEEYFDRYASNQLIIYRVCNGISTMFAGFALFIGYQLAYATDLITGIVQICMLASLTEIVPQKGDQGKQIPKAILDCFYESFRFLFRRKKVSVLMFCNCLVGTLDILLLFFLQAKLMEKGLSGYGLGMALLFMELGGVLGAKLTLKVNNMRYWTLFVLCAMMVIGGIVAEHSPYLIVMVLGGFLSSMGDDALQVRTNTKIQGSIPSEQRATLISIESFMFSVIMIVLSPLAGMFFTIW